VKDNIIIPIYSLHRDPQYYPDPDRFDPERFSDENKSKINPYTYLPFGTGAQKLYWFQICSNGNQSFIFPPFVEF
jgi:hypothetical protein